VAFSRNNHLSLSTEYVSEELIELGIDLGAVTGRRVRREINVGASRQGISSIGHVGAGRLESASRSVRQRQRLHLRGLMSHRRVSNAVAILGERFQHQLAVLKFLEASYQSSFASY